MWTRRRAESNGGQVQIGGQVFHYTRPLLLLFGLFFSFFLSFVSFQSFVSNTKTGIENKEPTEVGILLIKGKGARGKGK